MSSIFVLGAGFSKPAGLPLGRELFPEILREAKNRQILQLLERDIASFLKYLKSSRGITIAPEQIDFEEFISYLDVEHFLMLKGSDHWSEEGNEGQIAIRNLIALVLHSRQSAMKDSDYALYDDFVRRLSPGDFVIGFNYDTILENAFKRVEIPHRLFPIRYSRVFAFHGEVEENESEAILLKMHGSIDWFDISNYERNYQDLRRQGIFVQPRNAIFVNHRNFFPEKIIDGPYFEDSPLQNIYRIENLDKYLRETSLVIEAPLIISPSFSKMVYLNPLREFWRGFNSAGLFQKRVVIIGFSLPEHDEYIRQPLHKLITNFQEYDPHIDDFKKAKFKIVDFRQTEAEIAQYQDTYRFVNWTESCCYFQGFNKQALDMIFSDS
jgi:hypothetical protein